MATLKFNGGAKLQAALEAIAEKAGKAKSVDIGFMEGATYPDGTSVPMVAAIQNYGAPAAGIPPRPFFSSMVKDKSPEWGEKLGNVLTQADYDSDLALARMGEGIKGQLLQSINETNTPPLADATVQAKGFAKPLVETRHMQNSVDYKVNE